MSDRQLHYALKVVQHKRHRPGSSGGPNFFRDRNFKSLFAAIEREQEAFGTLRQSADRIKAILGA